MNDYTGPYVRTQSGHAVHKPDCRTIQRKHVRPILWSWADGYTPEEIREMTAGYGIAYSWCRYCFGGMRGVA
jgi:hypothetical protein